MYSITYFVFLSSKKNCRQLKSRGKFAGVLGHSPRRKGSGQDRSAPNFSAVREDLGARGMLSPSLD